MEKNWGDTPSATLTVISIDNQNFSNVFEFSNCSLLQFIQSKMLRKVQDIQKSYFRLENILTLWSWVQM